MRILLCFALLSYFIIYLRMATCDWSKVEASPERRRGKMAAKSFTSYSFLFSVAFVILLFSFLCCCCVSRGLLVNVARDSRTPPTKKRSTTCRFLLVNRILFCFFLLRLLLELHNFYFTQPFSFFICDRWDYDFSFRFTILLRSWTIFWPRMTDDVGAIINVFVLQPVQSFDEQWMLLPLTFAANFPWQSPIINTARKYLQFLFKSMFDKFFCWWEFLGESHGSDIQNRMAVVITSV